MSYAKNIYIDWNLPESNYNMVIKSWYCGQNAPKTYWAVHQWYNGYAGFQNNIYNNNISKKEIILAIWDDGANTTNVEYKSNLAESSINFNENGPGKHVITDISWQDAMWYKMAVGVKYDSIDNITYYAHWVTQETSDDWTLYAVISLPGGNHTLNKSSVFQEDYGSNNLIRECRIRNAYGRSASTSNWQLWSQGTIKSYDPNDNIWNDTENCWCDIISSSDGKYILLRSGDGAGDCMFPLAYNFNLQISGSFPQSCPIFPHYIKNCGSGKYINPSANGNAVVQLSTRYWWEIIVTDDGYAYIVTPDKTKAITISGTNDGDDLIMAAFTGNDNQKWLYIEDQFTPGTQYYLSPKNALLKCMDIEEPSSVDGKAIQLWTRNTTTQKYKWIIF